MERELNELQQKPNRPAVEQEIKKAEQRSFDRSYLKTRKQIAATEGAAAGAAAASSEGGVALAAPPEGAIERARARALAPDKGSAEPAVLGTPAAAPAAPSGRFIQGADGQRYPEEFFDLSPADQKRFKELMTERKQETADESVAIQGVNQLLDQLELMSKRLMKLEKRDAEKDSLIVGLTRLVEQQNNAIEVAKSQELAEQQAALAQLSISLQGVGAAEQAAHDQRVRESQQQAVDHQARIEAAEEPVARLEGRLTSASTIYEQGIIANQGRLEQVDAGTRAVDVRLQEVEGRVDVLGSPITRKEVDQITTDKVGEEVRAQAPELVDQAITTIRRDEFPSGFFGQRVDGDRTRQLRADATRIEDQQLRNS